MLTAVQVRLLAVCPTCGAPASVECAVLKRYRSVPTYQKRPVPNHRLRVRAAEARATALRLSGRRYHPI